MKYYGQFNPPVDKIIHERYFQNVYDGISIECGAYDGHFENCTKFFEENFNWKTINIEPLPHIYKRLILNRPTSININIALSYENISKNIRVFDIPNHSIYNTNASISHLPKHQKLLESVSNNKHIDYKVECNTYTQLIDKLNLKHLDLFILDVEGHEYEVIDGMIDAKVFPSVFVIEHGHRSPQEIENKLKVLPVKYELDYISNVNSFFVKK